MQTTDTTSTSPVQLSAAIQTATRRIAPLWPLTHFVAVNPFVGLTGQRFQDACRVLNRATGKMPMLTAAQYREAYASGQIAEQDIESVTDEHWPKQRLLDLIEEAYGNEQMEPVMTFACFMDGQRPHSHWEVLIIDEISKWCAVKYDDNQTTWRSPWVKDELYAGWREAAEHDCNPEAYGLSGYREFIKSLPRTADETIAHCMQLLEQPEVDPVDFIHRQLMTVSGWAGYLRYLDREKELRGGSGNELVQLLAIRLAYDAALHHAFVQDGSQRSYWRRIKPVSPDRDYVEGLSRWQQAYELGYQRELLGMLKSGGSEQDEQARPAVQAVFCIDVRSERLRRHLEAAMPAAQTIGFAGFFGFPISHQGAGQDKSQARCPVLLVPPLDCPDVDSSTDPKRLIQKWSAKRTWKAFQNSAASCFSFVEAMGLGFIKQLAGPDTKVKSCCPTTPKPDLEALPIETLAEMAEGALRNMSLTRNFARLVMICGHGSHSSNNPYASALDCGACGGHAGDLNARLAAMALNQPKVREHLASKGIVIPEDTQFVAGLHDTLSDEVELLDASQLPESHHGDVQLLCEALKVAGAATRAERASTLGIEGLEGEELEKEIMGRGQDTSQVRPEWGLANNAAILIGDRARSQGVNLDGRVFLHDYDHSADKDLSVLTLILCAPVVVASWINLQYYGSRVNPSIYGSGDKALHNVLGGIGVMEGNGGDLRTGLPMQSIHDGEKFVHEPRRLSVLLEAPREAIDQVLESQPGVKELFDNGWIHLIALEGSASYRYAHGGWTAFQPT
ncbi:MAG: DUF2309 domain-containing protein [Akkermansiaceae bacterium]|nr:DUF2309 domain-containing protein [Akkermansiaceae bacterium]